MDNITIVSPDDFLADPYNALPRIRQRKSHSKSNRGCLTCKGRRLKCDEGHPICSRCQSSRITCKYDILAKNSHRQHGKSSSESPLDRTLTPYGSRLDIERLSLPYELHPTSYIRNALDIRLLRIYLEGLQTQKFPLMKQSPELIRIREIEIPKLAFNNELVMSALLAACAAAQCMHNGTKTEYLFQEMKHRHNALASFRLALQKPVTSANRDAVLLTMVLLTIHALFLNDDPESFQGLLSNSYLMVLSGARAIWDQIKDSMEDSVFYPLMQDYQEWKLQAFETDNTICVALHEMCNIAEIRTKAHTSSPLIESDQHMAALHLTIDHLKSLIQFSNASYPPRVMLYFVLRWPSLCPPTYLQLIEIGDPLALAILAHYLACAQSIPVRPWPRVRVRSRCIVLCHHLRGLGMDKWIAWPESICSEEFDL